MSDWVLTWISTSDHIFTLHNIIDKVISKKKNLFACFVDLKNHLTLFGGKVCYISLNNMVFRIVFSSCQKHVCRCSVLYQA